MDKATPDIFKATSSLKGLGQEMQKMAAIGVAAFTGAVAGMVAMGKSAIDSADAMSKAAQRAGTSTEEISALSLAADLADASMEDLQKAFKGLSAKMLEAQSAGSDAKTALSAIGVSAVDSTGRLRNTHEVLLDIAQAFSTYADGAGKVALANDLFGKSGQQLIPLLNEGRAGLEASEKQARQFGLVISTETGKRAEEFNDNLTRVHAAVRGLGSAIAEAALPTLVNLSRQFLNTATGAERLSTTASNLVGFMKSIVTAAVAGAAVFAGLASVVGGVAVLAIRAFNNACDQVIAVMKSMFEGAKSVAGSFVALVQTLGGLGDVLSKVIARDFEGAWKSATGTVKDFSTRAQQLVWSVVGAVTGTATTVADGFTKMGEDTNTTATVVFDDLVQQARNASDAIDAIWAKPLPAKKPAGEGGGRNDAPAFDDKAVADRSAQVLKNLIQTRDLEIELTSAALDGFAQQSAAADLNYNRRLEQISGLGLVEDQAIQFSNLAAAEYYAKQAEIAGKFYEDLKKRKTDDWRQQLALASQHLQSWGSLFGSLAQLSAAFGKKSFGATQALRYAEAIVNTAAAVTNALASPAPWPIPLVYAAAASAAGLAQVITIASTKAPSGQAHSGLDHVPRTGTYTLEQGEAVIRRNENERLSRFLDRTDGGGSSGSQPIQLIIDGRIFAELMGAMSRDGRMVIDGRSVIA